MEKMVNIHIEKTPESVYMGTSPDIPGLVVQARTVTEVLEIARDVARKWIEAETEKKRTVHLQTVPDAFNCPVMVRG